MADATKVLEVVIQARDEASKVLGGFSSSLKDAGANMRTAGVAMAAIGGATVLVSKGFIDAAGQMEATRTAFKVLIGDSKLAEATLKDLFELESKTPFTIETVLQESKKLLAMGTSAKDLTGTLKMLGDVAAGVGFEKLPQLTLAFGQIQAKGRLMGTELRQLTEAGFNLADAMGISNEKLDQLVEDKAVKFEDVRAAFEKVTGEGGRFNGMMDSLAQTTPGKLSTLESSIFKLQVAFGEALLPAVNKIVDALIPLVERFGEWAKANPELVTALVTVGLALAAIGTAILIIMPILAGLAATISLVTGAFTGIVTVVGIVIGILGGPLTIIILAIIAIAALLALAWKNNWGDIQGKTKVFVDWFKGTAWPVIQQVAQLIMQVIGIVAQDWVNKFNMIKGAVEAVVGAIRAVISAAQDMSNKVKGGLKIPGFQHGGFVPGAFNQAVPAILHGGERVIPRTGVDVNGGGGGGMNLALNFTGPVSMDSSDRVDELANRVIEILGRQNELAGKGVGF